MGFYVVSTLNKAITLVAPLITLLISTHEPPRRGFRIEVRTLRCLRVDDEGCQVQAETEDVAVEASISRAGMWLRRLLYT